jgi:hypothetical protein
MSAVTLRLDAAALDDHARRCDQVADRLAARHGAMRGLLDPVVALHVRSTWDSPTATERRTALRSRRDGFETLRSDLASLVVQLRSRADADRIEARALIRRAENVEQAARVAAIEAQPRRTAETADRSTSTTTTPRTPVGPR